MSCMMLQKDTPPSSPDVDDSMEDEEMIYVGDVEQVLDLYDAAEDQDQDPDQDSMDENSTKEELQDTGSPEQDDAICVFRGHARGASVFCGCLSNDGKLAVTGGEDDQAYVWDTSSGDIFLNCTGHKDSIIFTEFNYDESYLATGDMTGVIQVWRMADKLRIWDCCIGDATWMKWHMGTNVLLAGSVHGQVYMWKIPHGDCKVINGHGRRVETGSILPDGKRAAVGYEDGLIQIIDLKTSSVLSSVSGHSSTVTTIDCHLDNNLIISADVNGKTLLCASNTGKIISTLQNLCSQDDSNYVESAVFSKDPEFQVAATGTDMGEIFVWDISKQVLRQKIEQKGGVSKLVWKGKTPILCSAGLDGTLRCFDARTGQCVRSFVGHAADIFDLCISENGEKALTTSDDFTARIFDISSIS